MSKSKYTIPFFLSLLFASFNSNANSGDTGDIDWNNFLNTFAQCDTSFFAELNRYQDNLAPLIEIKHIDESFSYIKVPDRATNKKNHILFSTPIVYKNLVITGYYDSAMNLGKHGDYYFWGFIFNNELKEIQNSLKEITWKKMEDNLVYIANAKIRYATDDLNNWHENTDMIMGVKTIPTPGTTEKLILLEKNGTTTSLLCSIQGFVPSELLRLNRPDIKKRPNGNF